MCLISSLTMLFYTKIITVSLKHCWLHTHTYDWTAMCICVLSMCVDFELSLSEMASSLSYPLLLCVCVWMWMSVCVCVMRKTAIWENQLPQVNNITPRSKICPNNEFIKRKNLLSHMHAHTHTDMFLSLLRTLPWLIFISFRLTTTITTTLLNLAFTLT